MPLNSIEINIIREKCRSRIESVELWMRRIIDEELTKKYGQNYINTKVSVDNYLIKKEIRDNINTRFATGEFPRLIDAGYFENLIDIITHPNLYDSYFKKYLIEFYPQTMPNGQIHLKFSLERLKDIRNNLSHANSISIRDAEFVLSLTTELIESFKKLYNMEGKQQEYNVPQITKITDSFGNVIIRKNFGQFEHYFFDNNPKFYLRPGDILSLEVEVDPSYTDAKYQFRFGGARDYSYDNKLVYTIRNHDVSARKTIHCQVRSDKAWHKTFNLDDQITLFYKVVPPIE